MADQNAKAAADNAIEVRESIEAKAAAENEGKDAPEAMDTAEDGPADQDADGEPDEDADGEADPEADAEGEEDEDAEGEDDDAEGTSEEPGSRRPGGLSSDMNIIIENTANYLSSYREKDGYQIAQHFQRVPNRRLVPDYYDVIKEGIAFSTIRVRFSIPYLPPQVANLTSYCRPRSSRSNTQPSPSSSATSRKSVIMPKFIIDLRPTFSRMPVACARSSRKSCRS